MHALLVDLGADRTRDLPRLPTVGTTAFGLYWRKVCELIDKGMFAAFGLDELVAEASRRFPGNQALRALAGPGDLRVLCLLAGPENLNQLRLRQEHKIILDIAGLRGARALHVTWNPAARRDDIVREILARRPDVVHFAGHGTADGSIVFEEDDGMPGPVRVEALAAVFGVLPYGLSCLVLGSCFSARYAGGLLGPVRAVAGSVTALPDLAACEFTRGFYTALATGGQDMTMPRAFRAGLAQMEIKGHSTTGMRFEPPDPGGAG